MPVKSLEERVSKLELQLAALNGHATGMNLPAKDWRHAIGMFDGDDLMEEVFDEALRAREADRRLARRIAPRKPKGTR